MNHWSRGDYNHPLIEKAELMATALHFGQVRKGTKIPYVEHPKAVARMVMALGGGTDEYIAALLHDTIEDCGVNREFIARHFNDNIAYLVMCCTTYGNSFISWKKKKTAWLKTIARATDSAKLVAYADKLHNAMCILSDLQEFGEKTWEKFSQPKSEVIWYYGQLAKLFDRPELNGIFNEIMKVSGEK